MEPWNVYVNALPGLAPVATAALLVCLLLTPAAAARWRLAPPLAWAWLVCALVPMAGLLTPSRWNSGAELVDLAPLSQGFVGSFTPVAWSDLWIATEPSLNVWLFVPLGLATSLCVVAGGPRRLVLFALAVPFLGESVQGIVPALDRVGLQAADVAANVEGLALGTVAGALVGLLLAPVLRGHPAGRRNFTHRPVSGPTARAHCPHVTGEHQRTPASLRH